jgi:RHS repeat-associated protein
MATRIVSCRAIGVAHRARTSRGEYHGAGSLTQDGRWEYSWDAENRLIRVQSRTDTPQASWRTVQWQYDALGRRIRETTWTWNANSGTWEATEDLKFVSEATLFGRRIAELNASDSALVRTYVWGLDLSGTEQGAGGVGGLLWLTQHAGPNTGTHFAAYDGNGNIVALSAASDGSATARYEYGPFAEPIRVTRPVAALNPFRFSTKRTDNTTDLVLYEYRAYSPLLGCWLSWDRIEEQGGRNLCAFVGNAPVNNYDVLGWAGCSPCSRTISGTSTADEGGWCGALKRLKDWCLGNLPSEEVFGPESR